MAGPGLGPASRAAPDGPAFESSRKLATTAEQSEKNTAHPAPVVAPVTEISSPAAP